ncbi:hypothetical protein [Halomonas litopenaei]|uniref:hypothetical protein n=1 Tax=Halomonas litopenaei TaxID=2109328 RepID=UPI003FA0C2FD
MKRPLPKVANSLSHDTSVSRAGLGNWQGLGMALLLGLACFWAACGNPLEVLAGGMMIDTDYPNAAAAFEIFVRDEWRWPLGASPHFGGVNIFFSDGSPWFALLSKLTLNTTGLFLNFHVLAILNVLLFAVMARRLSVQIAEQETVRWLITALLVFSLIMPVRMIGAQHLSLSAYWVVLWAMCAVPLKQEGRSGWRDWEFLATAGIAILSHAYLGAMAITIICVALLVERRWLATLAALLWPLLLLFVIGVFDGNHSTTQGAKAYSLDLAAFAETLGWGMPPNLYEIRDPTQSDAILYLGTGTWVLALSSLAVVAFFVLKHSVTLTAPFRRLYHAFFMADRLRGRRLAVWFAAALVLALYAMAFDIRIAGTLLWSTEIPSPFLPLYERFRVTGRFAAPLAFVLIICTGLIWGMLRQRLPGPLWRGVAGLVVFLQLLDVIHAGTKSPPQDWLANAAQQREAVESVLEGQEWSGRVYKAVGYFELEQQRLIDRLLVDEGARHFEVVHGARLDPQEVERRSGYAKAKRGDVVVLRQGEPGPACQARATIKNFTLCLLK